MRITFKRKMVKTISVFLLVNMAMQLIAPLTAYGLTSGPSTPEVQTFTPAGTTDMVDIFTGKFGYNLPVFELPGPNGGYPFNLSYSGGISMDQEASWVGLGWNLAPGSINREVRGLPDDFNGDIVKYRHDMLPNSTIGVNVAFNYELFGGDFDKGGSGSKTDISIGLNLYYNSYRGFGLSLEPGVGYHGQNSSGTSAGFGLKLKMDSQDGVGLDPTFSISNEHSRHAANHASFSMGIGYNSKRGLTDLSYGFSSTKNNGTASSGKDIISGSMSFAHTAYAPSIDMEMVGYNASFMIKLGGYLDCGNYLSGELGGYYTSQSVKNANADVTKKAFGYLSAEQVDQNTSQDVFDFNREKDGLVRDETPNLGIPSMTHDVYNISGQGISGSFRPYRPYISTMFDPHSSSLIGGGSLGFDIGVGGDEHFGVELTVNVSRTTANEATATSITNGYGKDDFINNSNPNTNAARLPKDYETYYFKCTGEPTTEVRGHYAYMNFDQLTDLSGALPPTDTLPVRKPRNSSVQEYRNSELGSNNYLQEFRNVGYYDFSSSQDFTQTIPGTQNAYQKVSNYSPSTFTSLSRNTLPQHHIGGYTVLQPDGSRYVYGLPVYNSKQVDKYYSVSSVNPSTGKAWDMDVSGSESAYAPSMLASSSTDRNFHHLLSTAPSGGISSGYNENSQCYLNRMELPPYTTSHMITSILGADYVDVDNNGPSENDFGYWVKFTYVKVPKYNWKVPYIGANYAKGLLYPGKDDKASYQYGEKDVYYLATAETKTHIAIFDISQRLDAAGIPGEFNDQSNPNAPPSDLSAAKSYKLNRIRLYSKMEYYDQSGNVNSNAQPISTANFEYSYELCPGIPNFLFDDSQHSIDGTLTSNITGEGTSATPYAAGVGRPGTGKLTLKKVWFTYERSSRGALTPYQFHYSANNPPYIHKNQDRWGTYKTVLGTKEYDYPYTPQDAATATSNAQAWCLTDVFTPSGSHINVSYESSDYAYVQNKTAGQMFKIARTFIDDSYPTSSQIPQPDSLDHRFAKLYSGSSAGPGYPNAGDCKKVYFDLQGESYDAKYSEGDLIDADPAPNSNYNTSLLKRAMNGAILHKYIADLANPEGQYQLYYKVLIDMRAQNEPLQEYVSGYANFQPDHIGFDNNCINNNPGDPLYGKITRGYIYLDMPQLGKTVRDFVPFSVAAWQFFKSSMSEYASDPGKLGTPAGQQMSTVDKALEVASSVVNVRDLFTTFYGRASRHTWASRIDLNHSWIRLCTPYKKKYGGGHRVSKITIQTNWDHDSDNQTSAQPTTYGVTYDYNDYANPIYDLSTGTQKLDANGNPMYESSGVAQYEPSVGGDEISLRYARTYAESTPLKTANNVYFEYPVNEGYFPGPTVGYSKVTVKSLATDNQLKNLPAMAGVAGTGITVHEFYTAKDFPVITEMSDISKREISHVYVPIPFIGQLKFDEMKAHQGYKIEVNDMHGKPKKVSYYGQDMSGNVIKGTPLSYVEYTYQTGPSTKQNGNIAGRLSSSVGVMTGEGVKVGVTNSTADYEMGVEYDCFTDMRHSATRSGTGGLSINAELMQIGPIPIPAFIPWPSIGYSQTEVNTGVTNKVIRRTGILTETKAYDGNSLVKTDNLYYDAQTGRPVLTTVTNDFDAPIYKYNIPAYWVYDGMGGAYKNFGLTIPSGVSFAATPIFNVTGFNAATTSFTYEANTLVTVPDNSLFVSGDEFTFAGVKGTVQRVFGTNLLECTLYATTQYPISTSVADQHLRIIRSGRRNLLHTDAGNITALQDPTIRVTGAIVPSCNTNSLTYTSYSNPPIPLPPGFIDFVKSFLVTDQSTGYQYFTGPAGTITSSGTILNNGITFHKRKTIEDINHNFLSTYNILGQYLSGYINNTTYPLSTNWLSSTNTADSMVIEECPSTHSLHFVHVNDLIVNLLPNNFDGCHNFIKDPSGRDLINSRVKYILPNDQYTIKVTFVNSISPYEEFTLISTPLDNILNPNDALSSCCDYLSNTPVLLSCATPDTPSLLSKVLSATSVKFENTWPQDFNQYRGTTSNLSAVLNPYATGAAGIWRPYQTYTYVDDRGKGLNMSTDNLTDGSNTYTKVNLSKDGTFDNMPMYNWYNPSFPQCFPQWRLTNTITQYSPYGYENENMDILKNFSAALYGYDGKLPIAVASNTSYGEAAFEGFEEYRGNNNVTMPQRSSGNFTIVNDMTNFNGTNYQKIPVAFGSGNTASINMDYNAFIARYGRSITGNVMIQAEAGGDGWPYENIACTSTNTTLTSGTLMIGTSGNPNTSAPVMQFFDASGASLPNFQYGNDARCWTGYIYIPVTNNPNYTFPNISFVNTRAHTGLVSMKVTGATDIPQLDLKLQPGKRYVIGAWVSPSANAFTVDGANGLQNVMTSTNWAIKVGYGTATIPPASNQWYTVNTIQSKIIDGWVRLEDENYIAPSSIPAGNVLWLHVEPIATGLMSGPVYIDDLRIHPYDGNMKSYVYDPRDYKLKAELDNNNYATFYSYDAAGNLFQIKRETEEGIITVQESRSHIKEN